MTKQKFNCLFVLKAFGTKILRSIEEVMVSFKNKYSFFTDNHDYFLFNFYWNGIFFNSVSLLKLFLNLLLNQMSKKRVESSKNCGPFNELNYTKPIDYLFKLKNNIENSNEILKAIILVITSPGLIAFLLFILVGGTFTSYSLMSSYKESIELLNRAHEENKLKRKEYNEKLKQIKRNVNMKRISRSARQTMIMNEMMHEIDNLISENETNDNNENFNSFNDIQIESESRERSSVRRSDKSKIYDLDEDLQI